MVDQNPSVSKIIIAKVFKLQWQETLLEKLGKMLEEKVH